MKGEAEGIMVREPDKGVNCVLSEDTPKMRCIQIQIPDTETNQRLSQLLGMGMEYPGGRRIVSMCERNWDVAT